MCYVLKGHLNRIRWIAHKGEGGGSRIMQRDVDGMVVVEISGVKLQKISRL